MFSMLHNQHSSLKEVGRHTQGILDWRRSVPISFHKDHRNVINDLIAKFVTHVLTWPDSGSLEIASRIPLSQEFHRRISSQQVLSPGGDSETRINQRTDNYFFRLPNLPEIQCRLRPVIIMSVIKRENKSRFVSALFCGKGSLEVLLTQADRYRLAGLFILHLHLRGRCFKPPHDLSCRCHQSTHWQVRFQLWILFGFPPHSLYCSQHVRRHVITKIEWFNSQQERSRHDFGVATHDGKTPL